MFVPFDPIIPLMSSLLRIIILTTEGTVCTEVFTAMLSMAGKEK